MKDGEFLENTEEDGDLEEEEDEELVEPTTTKARRTETPISPPPSRDEGPSDICQYCGKPQSHYDYKKEWRGWVKCPGCGKKSRMSDVPENLVREIKTVEKDRSSPRLDESDEEIDDDEGLFKRTKPPHEILEEVMAIYNVKEPARARITARCKRLGEPEVADIDRMLKDFDTGISNKQISYIIEDYLLALDSEKDRAEDMDGTVFPIGRRRTSRDESGGSYYAPDRRRRYQGRYGEPETSSGVSREELIRLLDDRDRRNREREDQQKKDDLIREQREAIEELRDEIVELRNNPPEQDSSVLTKEEFQKLMTEQQNQSMLVMMKDTLEQTRREADRLRDDQKEERKMLEAKIDKLQDNYDKKLDEANKKVLEEQRRADTRPAGDGYQHDETRLLADAVREGTEVLKSRGSIADGLAKLLPALSNLGSGAQAPGINKRSSGGEGGPSVADLMDDEFVR